MPPVLGPVSPSPSRLWSWAGASGSTRSPSHSASSETSSPSSRSSISTRAPESPKRRSIRHARTAASASAASSQTIDALARGQAVGLDHDAAADLGDGRLRGRGVSQIAVAGGGHAGARPSPPWRTPSSPRSGRPPRPGRSMAMPAARSLSARPATSGASGPITTRSAAQPAASSVSGSRSPTPHVVAGGEAADAGVAGRSVQLAQAGRAARGSQRARAHGRRIRPGGHA